MTNSYFFAVLWLTLSLALAVIGTVFRGAQLQKDGSGKDNDAPSNAICSLIVHLGMMVFLVAALGVLTLSKAVSRDD